MNVGPLNQSIVSHIPCMIYFSECKLVGADKEEAIFRDMGLEHWIGKTKDILKLRNLKLLKYVTLEEFDKVLCEVDNEIEKRALVNLFDKINDGSTKGAEVDENEKTIRKALKDEGLDDTVWVPRVKSALQLDSICLLKNTYKSKFESFVDTIHNLAEKRALQKVYETIVDKYKNINIEKGGDFQQKIKDDVEKANTNFSTRITEASKEYKRTVPDDFGKAPEFRESMRDAIDKLTPRGAESTRREVNWTAAEAVRKVQAGELCKGIFLTADGKKSDKIRQRVITVHDSIEYLGTVSSHEPVSREFSCSDMEDDFKNNTDKWNFGWSADAKGGFQKKVGGGVQCGKAKEEEKDTRQTQQTNYMAVTWNDTVPVRAIDITLKDISLRPEVLASLQDIEQSLQGIEKSLNYKPNGYFHDFFKQFGSHINYGVIELGGSLASIATCNKRGDIKRSDLRKAVSEAARLSLSLGFSKAGFDIGIGTSFNASKLHAKTSSGCKMTEFQNIDVTLKKTGGPPEIDDKIEWRKGLVENSSLWHIVSRNDGPKPIRELLTNYSDTFLDSAKLSQAMKEDWDLAQDISRYSRMSEATKWLQDTTGCQLKPFKPFKPFF